MKKNYGLDAKILLQSPDAIYGFADNAVHITNETIQELAHALNNNVKKENAKEALNLIRTLISNQKNAQDVVINQQGGILFVHKSLFNTHKSTYEETLLREIQSVRRKHFRGLCRKKRIS